MSVTVTATAKMPVLADDRHSSRSTFPVVLFAEFSGLRPWPRGTPIAGEAVDRLDGVLRLLVVLLGQTGLSVGVYRPSFLVHALNAHTRILIDVREAVCHRGDVLCRPVIFDRTDTLLVVKPWPSPTNSRLPFLRPFDVLRLSFFLSPFPFGLLVAGRSPWTGTSVALTFRPPVRLPPFVTGQEDTLTLLSPWPARVRPWRPFLSPQLTPPVVGPCPVGLKADGAMDPLT